MTHIKKLVMQGFKSFVKKTELPLTPGINVILGPNGSGKSNVSDGLCFVLGRLSVKSMRAAKAKNLIFMGSKAAGPAKEASVEMILDNEDGTFSLDQKEISIKRILRKNGQSLYKINGQTRTRQEVLTLLAQGGIDPNGFNIILQGEIQNFVKMQGEERRKIIEEVAGISIYESRKEKSLKELEKTEEKLKEVHAVLRERTAYLNNLEKERQQALRYKKLEEDVRKYKASIVHNNLRNKKKESDGVEKRIEDAQKEKEKFQKEAQALEAAIYAIEENIVLINKKIQQQTGLEQETLNREIANLRAELAGIEVKGENFEKKIAEIIRNRSELNEIIRNNELSIRELQKESPSLAQKQKELEKKKADLETLEKERKKYYMTRSELRALKDRIEDKTRILGNYNSESEFLLKQIDQITIELFDPKTSIEKIEELKKTLLEKQEQLGALGRREVDLEKLAHTNEHEIDSQKGIIEKIAKIDVCPLCKSKITEDHIHSIKEDISPRIETLESQIVSADKELNDIYTKREVLKKDCDTLTQELRKRESDLVRISTIMEKKEQIKALQTKIVDAKKEIESLEKHQKTLEKDFDENSSIEHRYESMRLDVQDISLRTEENVNSEITFKRREAERSKAQLKQLEEEEDNLHHENGRLKKLRNEKETLLEQKRAQEEKLVQKSQKLIGERDSLQRGMRDEEGKLSEKRTKVQVGENHLNNAKIEKARVDAEIESLEIEMLEFPNVEVVRLKREVLIEKLHKTQNILSSIGSVNLRSLEVYDEIKKEYDTINEKVEVITKERESILRVIHEIDVKKKKAFLKTLDEVNDIFSRNFAQISTKGQVSLELENRKDPFAGGVTVQVKTGHGKFFDVTSLSGGEQTMVALSLIFAIQEFRPYHFYILDEIDAALDKRNSERLASLLKKYMQQGQYIVITHNDEIITNATNLYGVSMHDGISKVVSMQL